MSQGLVNSLLPAHARSVGQRVPSKSPMRGNHLAALRRGEFMALVFCGRRDRLIDIAGETTAMSLYKFTLPDERLANSDDFARADGFGLPEWPVNQIEPAKGLCFVFAMGDELPLQNLRSQNAVEGEHYVIVGQDVENGADRHDDLATFINSLSPNFRIAIIGYGHQGSRMASVLRQQFDVSSDRLFALDDNQDSQCRAERDGVNVTATSSDIEFVDAVIYSPLSRYERLWRIVEQARRRGAPVFDNSRCGSGAKQFVTRGLFRLDAAANRALQIDGHRLSRQSDGLAIPCRVMREDIRQLGVVHLPHLHADAPIVITSMNECINVNAPGICDTLNPATWVRTDRAYVSLQSGAALGFFAARDLCQRIWSDATAAIFPSHHVIDLGATAFERLLLAHHDAREIVTAMQTPAQRVTLGIVANHYSSHRPIVEIGSAFGGSALMMAAATSQHKPPIYSVDPDAPTRDIMRFAFEREGYLDRLTQIVEPSVRAITNFGHLRGRAGLVFIDGLHTQAGVLSDFEIYTPLLAIGGALVFHDVVPALHGVFSAVMNRVMHDHRFESKCLVEGLMVFERCA